METWRRVWRHGFAPSISRAGLAALRQALANDDPRLRQGCTTCPPPLNCVLGWPVKAACCIGLCGWLGEGLTTVGQVEEYFADRCNEADRRLGMPAACRHFNHFFDDTPRDIMRAELLAEVEYELGARGALHLTRAGGAA